MTVPVVTQRELNRATLARQLLIERSSLDPVAATERIGGLQAQEPASPYVALWSRLERFAAETLDRAVHERRLVKAGLMRGTLHLVSAGDYLRLQPAIRVTLKGLAARDQYRNAEVGDIDLLIDAAMAFAGEPRDNAAMHDHLEGPAAAEGRMSTDVWWRVRREGAFIRAPSKVPWSFGRRPTYVAAGAWLGGRAFADDEASLDHLVRRYLGAFGPATIADLRGWSHVSTARLRPVVERLPGVVELRDENGRTLLDLADAPRPHADVPAPPRFLPMWDGALLGHEDRSRVLPDTYRKAVISRNGDILPTFMVDGRVAGLWWVEPDGARTRITLEPFDRLPKAARTSLDAEAERLRAFYEPLDTRIFARYRQSRARNPLPSG
ncbi:MAG TPA: winged helix DNA-binding domain-containing protein [Candidatus Limnocylindrales bacterium]|nr:winged helix DNA-binding domain-containing protein [Candidatus Limnocylindrales bacterium]